MILSLLSFRISVFYHDDGLQVGSHHNNLMTIHFGHHPYPKPTRPFYTGQGIEQAFPDSG